MDRRGFLKSAAAGLGVIAAMSTGCQSVEPPSKIELEPPKPIELTANQQALLRLKEEVERTFLFGHSKKTCSGLPDFIESQRV